MTRDREVLLTLSDAQYDELGRAIVVLRERFELDTSALVVRAVVELAAAEPGDPESAPAKA
jgi:hypothetical protein